MKNFFTKIPLPAKLVILGIIPLFAALFFALQINKEKQIRLTILDKYTKSIIESGAARIFADELQSERRVSFGYLFNKIQEASLILQRSKTDEALNSLEENQFNIGSFRAYTFLDELPEVRKKIERKEVDEQFVIDFYTKAITRINFLAQPTAENIVYLQPVSKKLLSQRILAQMSIALGSIRLDIYNALHKKTLSPETISQLRNELSVYKSFEQELKLEGDSTTLREYNLLLHSDESNVVWNFIEEINKTGELDFSRDPDLWWENSVVLVNNLKRLNILSVNEVNAAVKNIFQKEKQSRDLNLFIIFLIIAVVIFIILLTLRNISHLVKKISEASEQLAVGKIGISLHIPSKDIIGSLANSINSIEKNNSNLAFAANEIGKGNLNVQFTPRGEDDVIGNSVLQMQQNLIKFSKENEDKIWVQTGIQKINAKILGEKTPAVIAEGSLIALAEYLKIEVGVFYSVKESILQYLASYAIKDFNSIPKEIYIGENMAGQAAKTLDFKIVEIPENYITVSSLTGEVKPTEVAVIPLVLNEMCEGVIEIAGLNKFSAIEIELLKVCSHNIAIALHSSKNKIRLQELLEETQAQSEELQVQHAEMENLNSELEAQTQKLQASEEELRVQQEELRLANSELEERSSLLEERNQEIAERNIEVTQKASELEKITRYKSEFLANMSHELRTPLNSILLLSRLISENIDDNLSPDQIEYAKVIQTSGNELLSLIDEILDLSKIEAGKMQLEIENNSIGSIVKDLHKMFEPLAKQKGIEFSTKINIKNDSIETDRLRLGQVLKNLLSNAIKFTSQGAVSLEVNNSSKNGFIEFKVTDTGIGIPKEQHEQVFGAFQQADGSTRRKFGGTGLGLSISKELIKLLGGSISLESEPGKGSVFTVSIPHKKANEPLQDERLPEKTVSEFIPDPIPDDRDLLTTGDKSILIIEDDTNFAKSLIDFTHKQGYKAIVAVRGDEGIELAKKLQPTGILLDIMLPVKNGWQVMEELKKDPVTRKIPVHIMSSVEAKRESMVKGAVNFIHKPVAYEAMSNIFQKLEHVLSKENKKVLIVEENAKHAKALSYFLESYDVKADIKHNIDDSISALKGDIDCVVLDMGIPDPKTYEMLEKVKNESGLENIPIIIFTGKSLSLGEEQKIKKYADSIVVKTAQSYQRILDEVSLFLHLVESNLKQVKNGGNKKFVALNDILKNKTVLIVDDDVRNIFSLSKAMEKMGINILTAIDGKEALMVMNKNPEIDVVLLDMMMPEMDGYQTARKIRENKAWKNLPIIAITAKAMIGDREKCISAGASDYITKPVDIDQLMSLLRVWLYEKN